MESRGISSNAEVMTVPEVARLLRVTTKTVYKLLRTGTLRSFRIGRVVRCRRDEVNRFIGECEQSTTPQIEGRQ